MQESFRKEIALLRKCVNDSVSRAAAGGTL
jgi:hypothetical protein